MKLSLRARILLLVIGITAPSLAVVGVWLTRTVTASADRVLHDRLTGVAERSAADLVHRWAELRQPLLDFIESDDVQRALARGASLDLVAERIPSPFVALRLTGTDGRVVAGAGDSAATGTLPVYLPVYTREGVRLGTLAAWLHTNALVAATNAPAAPGAVISALNPATGRAVLALPFDVDDLDADRFSWGGEEWLVARRFVSEPRLELLVAAPRGAEAAALRAATRDGLLLLLALGLCGVVLAWLWSNRLTRSLRALCAAADSVARGELDIDVPADSTDEVGRVAVAFNGMATGLSRTLDRLADREALAAVGQLSAELAHDIRNPLTAIRLDLRYVEERLPHGSDMKEAQTAALAELDRLDATVNGALLLSRTRTLQFAPIPLKEPLAAACRSARPAFAAKDATLDCGLASDDIVVNGDAAALERLVQNLLFNAADAVERGGHAALRAHVDGEHAYIVVEDDGAGIEAAALPRIFEPQFTTKSGGSGFGLAIAQRIVRAHDGDITVESCADRGTRFRVRLPLHDAVTKRDQLSRSDAARADAATGEERASRVATT